MRCGGSAPSWSSDEYAEHPGELEVLRQHDADIQQRAQRRDHHPAAPELHAARGGNRQDVKRGEVTGDAAGDGDETGDDQRVAGELEIDEPSVALRPSQREQPQNVERVGEADQDEERLDRERSGRGDLHEHCRTEQQRADADADRDQPEEFATKVALLHGCSYTSLLIRSKIGRYIAMTMPPTAPPRNAIMIGSSSVSRPATAVSTSSS